MSSFAISVAVTINSGEETYVQVVRAETVIPANLVPDDELAQGATDLFDLIRAALDRLGTDAVSTASTQVGQLRGMFAEDLS